MAIDYYIQLPCQVRSTVSDRDLLRMEKARNRANAALDILRKNPQLQRDLPESEWVIGINVMGPNGPAEHTVKIADMLAEAGPLDELSVHCSGCPANLRNTSFGCGGAINYPITEDAERWLIAQLPVDLDGAAGQMLVRAINELQFTGAKIDAARSRKKLYAASKPAVRTWRRSFLSTKTSITSSQVMQMLVGLGDLQPSHARLVCYFLGLLNTDMQIDLKPDYQPSPSDDASIVQFKQFLLAAAFAGTNNVCLLVDA